MIFLRVALPFLVAVGVLDVAYGANSIPMVQCTLRNGQATVSVLNTGDSDLKLDGGVAVHFIDARNDLVESRSDDVDAEISRNSLKEILRVSAPSRAVQCVADISRAVEGENGGTPPGSGGGTEPIPVGPEISTTCWAFEDEIIFSIRSSENMRLHRKLLLKLYAGENPGWEETPDHSITVPLEIDLESGEAAQVKLQKMPAWRNIRACRVQVDLF